MTYSNKQLYDALSLIKNICKDNSSCDDCPLCDEDRCKVSDEGNCPADWTLNCPEHWRAFC